MSENEEQIQQTQHAFLVAWGQFAQAKGLTQRIEAVSLRQKNYHHRPQTKVLEFLVAILGGLKQLQEISLARSHWTRIRQSQKPGDKLDGQITAGSAVP